MAAPIAGDWQAYVNAQNRVQFDYTGTATPIGVWWQVSYKAHAADDWIDYQSAQTTKTITLPADFVRQADSQARCRFVNALGLPLTEWSEIEAIFTAKAPIAASHSLPELNAFYGLWDDGSENYMFMGDLDGPNHERWIRYREVGAPDWTVLDKGRGSILLGAVAPQDGWEGQMCYCDKVTHDQVTAWCAIVRLP